MIDVTILNADDWSGLYIQGQLVFEGHGISAEIIVEQMARHYPVNFQTIYDNKDLLLELGNCPPTLDEWREMNR